MKKGSRYLLTTSFVLLGIAFAFIGFAMLRYLETQKIENQFKEYAIERADGLERELEVNLQAVESLQAHLNSSPRVERAEFAEFVKPFLLRYRSIQALEWTRKLAGGEREEFERSTRREGFGDFQITERNPSGKMVRAQQRDEYFTVHFVEPYHGNEAALGYDNASNPIRLRMIEQARDTGSTLSTGRIRLVQEKANQYGFIVFAPVYRKGSVPDSVESRRRNLKGFAVGVFRVGDIVEKSAKYLHPAGVDMILYDRSAKAEEQLLYSHASRKSKAKTYPAMEETFRPGSGLEYVKSLPVGGREWAIICRPIPSFFAERRTWQPWGVLLTGLLFCGFLANYLLLEMRRSKRIEALVEELQNANKMLNDEVSMRRQAEEELKASETRYRIVADNTHGWEFWLSPEIRFLYVSPSCKRISGYGPEEFMANPDLLVSIIHPEDRPIYGNHLREVEETQKAKEIEYRIIHPDGAIRWISHVCQPVYDEGSRYSGVRGSNRDITDHKLAEEKIKALLSEKELLLKEVHHRIKNNMNTIISLMSLQSRTLKDPSAVAALKDAQSRVRSMMVLYDKLYRSTGFNRIAAREYLSSLIDEIIGNFPNRGMVKVENKIEDFTLDARILSPLGILINELLTNAMKYAFTGREDGVISVSAAIKENHVVIEIQDNGIGIPETVDLKDSPGFGLQLVEMLAEQMEGRIRIERRNGTKFILEFEV